MFSDRLTPAPFRFLTYSSIKWETTSDSTHLIELLKIKQENRYKTTYPEGNEDSLILSAQLPAQPGTETST